MKSIYYPFPFTSKVEAHLFIVLSVRQANEYQNTFIAVMITSSKEYVDDFSFELSNEIFDTPLTTALTPKGFRNLNPMKSYVKDMRLIIFVCPPVFVGERITAIKKRKFDSGEAKLVWVKRYKKCTAKMSYPNKPSDSPAFGKQYGNANGN